MSKSSLHRIELLSKARRLGAAGPPADTQWGTIAASFTIIEPAIAAGMQERVGLGPPLERSTGGKDAHKPRQNRSVFNVQRTLSILPATDVAIGIKLQSGKFTEEFRQARLRERTAALRILGHLPQPSDFLPKRFRSTHAARLPENGSQFPLLVLSIVAGVR